jgi:arginine/lysine/ornithine decarboxylase
MAGIEDSRPAIPMLLEAPSLREGVAMDVSCTTGELSGTPLCDRLLALRSRDIASFHALPLSRGRSIQGSSLKDLYAAVIGESLLRSDATITGELFDTPCMPKGCIDASRRLTAKAFGADFTSYVTTGTTTSNYVAAAALCDEGDRVLLDRLCHQSLHLAFRRLGARVTYAPSLPRDEDSNRSALDVDRLLELYGQAAKEGDPFRVVAITNGSYEGVLYDLRRLFARCAEIRDEVRFLVDEAWLAFGYFHPEYSTRLAIRAGAELRRRGAALAVVATQSAHKSLSALRQGSYVHALGDHRTFELLEAAQFGLHTTSPSYPILASLELARAQAVTEGAGRIDLALRLAQRVRDAVASEPGLATYRVNDSPVIRSPDVRLDPLRLSLRVDGRPGSAHALKRFLIEEFDLYVNHATATSCLFNIHLGIGEASVQRLLLGLREFAAGARARETRAGPRASTCRLDAGRTDRFLIAYPPGIPLAVPGEALTPELLGLADRLHAAGAEIVRV